MSPGRARALGPTVPADGGGSVGCPLPPWHQGLRAGLKSDLRGRENVCAASEHPSSNPPPTTVPTCPPTHPKPGTPKQQIPHCFPQLAQAGGTVALSQGPAGLLTNLASHSRWQAWEAVVVAGPWRQHPPPPFSSEPANQQEGEAGVGAGCPLWKRPPKQDAEVPPSPSLSLPSSALSWCQTSPHFTPGPLPTSHRKLLVSLGLRGGSGGREGVGGMWGKWPQQPQCHKPAFGPLSNLSPTHPS